MCQPSWRAPGLVLTVSLSAAVLALVARLPSGTAAPPAKDYLFCFWNVENLFDDKVDGRSGADKPFDEWFGKNKNALKLKLKNLTDVLVKLNDGKGPDILAVAEVESKRAAELLRDALNDRLPKELQYRTVLMEEVSGGRHIATAIITRLPVEADRTQLLDKRRRILEGHVVLNGHELVVLASHWTSHVSDDEGEGRNKYAQEIYARFRALYAKNKDVDLLVCGDFNDPPQSDSVNKFLWATDDPQVVREARSGIHLLNLMMGKPLDDFGTHFYDNKWCIFDHLVVSPGLLDGKGWACDLKSVHTVHDVPLTARGFPRRFGNERDPDAQRGASDHCPVTVRLQVHGK
jgi:endonuclease/exonuclease/phosphatase family metal-dependent hydrolase